MLSTIVVEIKGKHGNQSMNLPHKSPIILLLMKWNEMEYNGSNSRDQTDIAEMLIFHRTPFSQILDQTLVEAWQELINPS